MKDFVSAISVIANEMSTPTNIAIILENPQSASILKATAIIGIFDDAPMKDAIPIITITG